MRGFRIFLLTVSLCILAPAGLSPQQGSPPGTHDAKGTPPFSIGERLVYSVKWDPPWYLFFLPSMEAGEATLHLAGETEYKDKKALRIVFRARSSGRLMRLTKMNIEDEFVFLSEPETFCSLNVSQKIREGKRKRQIDVDYLRDTNQLHIRVLDESIDPPQIQKDEIKDNIPPCVQDPFSALYLFRKAELRKEHSQAFVIGNDDKFKEVEARVEKLDRLDTAFGKLAAWSVQTSALKGGLFRQGGQFRIWFSADERKLPIQFEANVGIGRVLGRLVSKKQ